MAYQPTPPRAASVLAAIALAVGTCTPFTMGFEGFAAKPYFDPAHIRTACYGDTFNIEDRIYSKTECAEQLRGKLAKEYAPTLLRAMPGLVDYPKTVFAALLDASYNTGAAASVKRFAWLFNSGRIEATCRALPGWFVTAKDRRTGQRVRLKGLVSRRIKEEALCLGR